MEVSVLRELGRIPSHHRFSEDEPHHEMVGFACEKLNPLHQNQRFF